MRDNVIQDENMKVVFIVVSVRVYMLAVSFLTMRMIMSIMSVLMIMRVTRRMRVAVIVSM